MSYKRQELLTLREHMSSLPVFLWNPCCSSFWFAMLCLFCLSLFCVVCPMLSVSLAIELAHCFEYCVDAINLVKLCVFTFLVLC